MRPAGRRATKLPIGIDPIGGFSIAREIPNPRGVLDRGVVRGLIEITEPGGKRHAMSPVA
jgi:hypothetical protein